MTPTDKAMFSSNDCGGCIDEDCTIPDDCAYHSPEKMREFLGVRAGQIDTLKHEAEHAKETAAERIAAALEAEADQYDPELEPVGRGSSNVTWWLRHAASIARTTLICTCTRPPTGGEYHSVPCPLFGQTAVVVGINRV